MSSQHPVIKKLSIVAPRVGFPMVLVFALLLFEIIVLFQFKTKYDGADSKVQDMQKAVDTANKFIADDCNFQYVRLNNLNVRLGRVVKGDQKRYDAQTALAGDEMKAGHYWTHHEGDLRISQYWYDMSREQSAVAQVTSDTEKMDKQAYQVLTAQRSIDDACKQKVPESPTKFIMPSPGN